MVMLLVYVDHVGVKRGCFLGHWVPIFGDPHLLASEVDRFGSGLVLVMTVMTWTSSDI